MRDGADEVAGVKLAPMPHPRRSAIVLETDDFDTAIAGARALMYGVVQLIARAYRRRLGEMP